MNNFKRKYKPSLVMAGIPKEPFIVPILSFLSAVFFAFCISILRSITKVFLQQKCTFILFYSTFLQCFQEAAKEFLLRFSKIILQAATGRAGVLPKNEAGGNMLVQWKPQQGCSWHDQPPVLEFGLYLYFSVCIISKVLSYPFACLYTLCLPFFSICPTLPGALFFPTAHLGSGLSLLPQRRR